MRCATTNGSAGWRTVYYSSFLSGRRSSRCRSTRNSIPTPTTARPRVSIATPYAVSSSSSSLSLSFQSFHVPPPQRSILTSSSYSSWPTTASTALHHRGYSSYHDNYNNDDDDDGDDVDIHKHSRKPSVSLSNRRITTTLPQQQQQLPSNHSACLWDRRYSMDHVPTMHPPQYDHHQQHHYDHHYHTEDEDYQYRAATTSSNPIFPPTKYLWWNHPQDQYRASSPSPPSSKPSFVPPSYSNDAPDPTEMNQIANPVPIVVNPTTVSPVPPPTQLPPMTLTSNRHTNHHRSSRPTSPPPSSTMIQRMQYHQLSLRNPDAHPPFPPPRTGALPTPVRTYHTTTVPARSTVAIVLGLGAVSVGAYALSSVVTAVQEFQQEQRRNPPPPPASGAESNTSGSGTNTSDSTRDAAGTTTNDTTSKTGSSKNIFDEWFGIGVNHKYYEGGFEEKMTRREAALILGIRESSTTARIKDAHRKLLVLNHPDTGGSTYVTHKINEAKELLLKGRTDK